MESENLNVIGSFREIDRKNGEIKMKIGILSMQRVSNYGSYWQARSLKEYFENKGHSVEFIDIKPGRIISKVNKKSRYSVQKIKYLPYYIQRYKRDKIFHKAQIEDLKCFNYSNYREDYDLIIIGSDEVFNFIQVSKWGFSPQLFGAINNKNICTYAASFGYSTYSDIRDKSIEDEMINYLANIRLFSVRDNNSYEIIHKLLPDKNIEENFDPVIIGNFEQLDRKYNLENYILIYAYDLRFNDRSYIKKIKSFACKKNLKIYSVGYYQTWCDKNIYPEPKDIFEWFLKAQYIITDTFHGSIFSMRAHKKFVTIVRESNKNKLEDLIKKCGMQNRIICTANDLENVLEKEIDYSKFEKIRDRAMEKSDIYLEKCIEGIKIN
ncbi:polysaccharide pyruvyl transferase family protein [Agathobacter sp.]